MFIPEVLYPGMGIGHSDRQWASRMEHMLSALVEALDDGAVGLDAYLNAKQRNLDALNASLNPEEKAAQRVQKKKERAEWIEGKAAARGIDPTAMMPESVRFELEAAYDHSQWQQGKVPGPYLKRATLVHAKSFLMAMDGIAKLLRRLLKEANVPQGVRDASAAFSSALPGLKQLRDSIAHHDERIHGEAKGKEIVPKAIDNEFIQAPAGTLFLVDVLNGDNFGSTAEDGTYASVDVNEATLQSARRCVQSVLCTFTWTGDPRRHPAWSIPYA